MSFGRSNSLSLNTGAANSLFTPSATATTTAPSGGLFGNTQTTAAATPSLFGNTQANNTSTAPSTSLFGNTAQTSNTSGTSLFGNNNNQAQPAATGTSLFGNTAAQPAATGSSLFGGNTQNNAATGTSLFGGTAAKPANTLGGSLFGNNTQAGQPATAGNSLFGASTAQQPATNALGASQQPSLFGAAQAAALNTQASRFAGGLSMGQGANPTAVPTVPAVKIDVDGLRPTTRFDDLTDQMKNELENIDKMIQQQESYCKQIEAMMPKHGQDIVSLTPDVDFIRDKVEAVEYALAADAQGVDSQRRVAEQDGKDVERCQRIITNLGLPQGYQFANLGYAGSNVSGAQRPGAQQQPPHPNDQSKDPAAAGSGGYDTDLIGNYFVPLARSMEANMRAYANNLVEIENHMRVIESSALSQAQRLAARKSGSGGVESGVDATVRELADTLRGFEASILSVAGTVGECREGVNELILGRFGANGNGVNGNGFGRY